MKYNYIVMYLPIMLVHFLITGREKECIFIKDCTSTFRIRVIDLAISNRLNFRKVKGFAI